MQHNGIFNTNSSNYLGFRCLTCYRVTSFNSFGIGEGVKIDKSVLINYRVTISALLQGKGYPINIDWDDLEGKTMQDDAIIQAAIVIDDALKEAL